MTESMTIFDFGSKFSYIYKADTWHGMDSQATASVKIELLFMSLHKDASKLHLNQY